MYPKVLPMTLDGNVGCEPWWVVRLVYEVIFLCCIYELLLSCGAVHQ